MNTDLAVFEPTDDEIDLAYEMGELIDWDVSYTGTGQRIQHHRREACTGTSCCIHKPSSHHMTMWPLHFRGDRAPLMERICRHGVGHPDPDSIAYLHGLHPNGQGSAWEVHGCDGCCTGTDGHFG